MATINKMTIHVTDAGAGPAVTVDLELAVPGVVAKPTGREVTLTPEQTAALAAILNGIRAAVTEKVRAELVLVP